MTPILSIDEDALPAFQTDPGAQSQQSEQSARISPVISNSEYSSGRESGKIHNFQNGIPPTEGDSSPLLSQESQLEPSVARFRPPHGSLSTLNSTIPNLISSENVDIEEPSEDWLFEGGGRRVRYDDFTTIDWIHDFAKERIRLNRLRTRGSWLAKVFDASQAWLIVAVVGMLTGCIAAAIVISEEWLFDLRTGYCSGYWYKNKRFCCQLKSAIIQQEYQVSLESATSLHAAMLSPCTNWVVWEGALSAFLYISLGTIFAFLAAYLVKLFAPYAAGSGIPEVKTILGGFIMRSFLGARTLVVKAIGLSLATASGMSLGKEGPLVHVACCVGNIFPRLFKKFARNEAKKREILSAAAAAGVACAFGAPIGGVLFSLEEVSYYFPYKTMLRSFFSAMMAAGALKVLNPLRTGKLVLFQVKYENTWHSFDVVFFVLLGVLGGLFGSFFIRMNLAIVSLRKWTWLRHRPVQEACIVALFTAIVSYTSKYLYISTGFLVSTLFAECPKDKLLDQGEFVELCDPQVALRTGLFLLLVAIIKTIMTVVTFGIRVPCGVFIPSMAVGACVGRTVGIAVGALQTAFSTSKIFSACHGITPCVSAGPYALLGAAAFLGGVTRMTVSLVVIMFEVTGALEYVLPIMITVMVAKFVGDAFRKESIYDGLIRLNGYPFLDIREEYVESVSAGQVMTHFSCLSIIATNVATIRSLELQLEQHLYKGYPIVLSHDNPLMIGFINRAELRYALAQARKHDLANDESLCYFGPLVKFGNEQRNQISPPLPDGAPVVDLGPWIDQTPITIVLRYPMEMTIELFKKMGLRYVLVTRNGILQGLITKKDVLRHLGRISIASDALYERNILHDRMVG